jgi:hypothetical protein
MNPTFASKRGFLMMSYRIWNWALALPSVSFWIFGLMSLFTFFFTWRVVPETKGKSLEEIESLWSVGTHQKQWRRSFATRFIRRVDPNKFSRDSRNSLPLA